MGTLSSQKTIKRQKKRRGKTPPHKRLKDKLGVKVNITDNKITIPFDSEGDLNRIFEIFNIDMDEE